MTEAPATEARVPSTLAIPSFLFKCTCSILQSNHNIRSITSSCIWVEDLDFRGDRNRIIEWVIISCQSTAAIRKVTAGTIFSVAEAKVGDVLSKPKRYNPWLHVILSVPKSKTVRQILGIIYSPIKLLCKRYYPTNPRRKNCTKKVVVNGGLSFLYIQRTDNSMELELKKDMYFHMQLEIKRIACTSTIKYFTYIVYRA